jgi:outer membrane protein TolC
MNRACWILMLGVTALPISWGQAPKGSPALPVLTLEDAVRIASEQNRDVQISELNVTKAREAVAEARTSYMPKLDTYLLGGFPLQQLNFTVPPGVFGTYPATGPIPAKESTIHSPQRLSAFIYGSAAQPLTQLYKVKLGVRQARLGADLARESVRAQQQETRRQVKEAYYQVAQSQAQVESARAALTALTALSITTERRLIAQTVLPSDSLTVKARLKQQRYQLLKLQDGFELQKQALNRLLGRDLRTQFSVAIQPTSEIAELDLDVAQKQALQRRPELREARLQTRSAQLDVRRERAEYIPDLSLQVSYLSFQNLNFLPQNAGNVGFLLQWQPFDWGYKKHKMAELTDVSKQKGLTEEDVQQQVLLDVEDKFRKLTEARMLLDAQTDEREAAQVKLREVTDRYTQESALLSDLLQQQASVSQADAQYQQALAGFWTARAEFEKAIGAD